MAESTPTLRTVVGRLIRERREELGLTQDDVAAFLRDAGAGEWNRVAVAALELGRRQLDLEELWLVCAGIELPLEQLLARGNASQWIQTGDGRHSLDLIRRCIAGEAQAITFPPSVANAEADAHDETVKRLARRLEVEPISLAELARRLWGQSLPRERDARLADLVRPDTPARTVQALRGHLTRQLSDELRAALQRKRGRK